MRVQPLYSLNRYWHSSPALQPSIVVAVPACNEAEAIGRCLRAIDASAGSTPVGIVGFINNSSDSTFEAACAQAVGQFTAVRIYDVAMAPAFSNAGGARRAAMELAADWLEDGGQADGLLLTTDADSEPADDWIARIQAAVAHGADAVAGTIDLYPEDAATLPPHVHARGALEARYDALLTELFSRLDPQSHDPWPRHATNAGANLAVRLRAYRAIGGLPQLACGEDKALVARLDREGFHVSATT